MNGFTFGEAGWEGLCLYEMRQDLKIVKHIVQLQNLRTSEFLIPVIKDAPRRFCGPSKHLSNHTA